MDINYFSTSSLILTGLFIFSLFVSSLLLGKMNLMDGEAARRNSPLDGLRGVLASAVVVHHFYINYIMYTTGEWVRPTTQILNNFGAVSVSFFFLITGYLFFSKIQKGNILWKQLYLSRVRRIVPLYLFVFIFIVSVTLYFRPLTLENLPEFFKWLRRWFLFLGGNFEDFPSGIVIAGVNWTLTYEWGFYFSLPIWYVLWHRRLFSKWYIVLPLSLLVFLYIWKRTDYHVYLLFLLALSSVYFKERIREILDRKTILFDIFQITLLILVVVFSNGYTVIQMVGTSILFSFIANGYSYGEVLNNNGLRKLGEISYSIYLTHGIILYALRSYMHNTKMQIGINGFSLVFPIIFTLVILISIITYRFIEYPFICKRKSE